MTDFFLKEHCVGNLTFDPCPCCHKAMLPLAMPLAMGASRPGPWANRPRHTSTSRMALASAVIKSAAHYYRPYPTRPLVHVV